MRADGAGGVPKTSLPQHRQVKQAFDEDHGRKCADRLPGKQASLGARQQAVRESHADTAPIQVDRTALLTAREDHAPTKSVTTLWIDQSCPQQQIEGITPVQ